MTGEKNIISSTLMYAEKISLVLKVKLSVQEIGHNWMIFTCRTEPPYAKMLDRIFYAIIKLPFWFLRVSKNPETNPC